MGELFRLSRTYFWRVVGFSLLTWTFVHKYKKILAAQVNKKNFVSLIQKTIREKAAVNIKVHIRQDARHSAHYI